MRMRYALVLLLAVVPGCIDLPVGPETPEDSVVSERITPPELQGDTVVAVTFEASGEIACSLELAIVAHDAIKADSIVVTGITYEYLPGPPGKPGNRLAKPFKETFGPGDIRQMWHTTHIRGIREGWHVLEPRVYGGDYKLTTTLYWHAGKQTGTTEHAWECVLTNS